MKQTVTDLNDPVELVVFVNKVIEHDTLDSYFGDLPADTSPNQNIDKLSKINNCKVIPFAGEIVHIVYAVNTNFSLYLSSWTLFFDGSKSKYGADAGCVLINPKGSKWIISCRLEFECTNKIVEYEALVEGMKEDIDLGADIIQCYGDSEIVAKHARNEIHCLTPHLLNYQNLVRDMTGSFQAFNINSVSRSQNFDAYLLDNTASRIIPPKGLAPNTFS